MRFQIVRTHGPRPYFWRIVDDDGQVVTFSSDMYDSRESCVKGIDAVKEGAAGARIEDLTGERGVG
jgi:uncharacterized protein YegP (UPF0339 family)